jgi:aryl-alcohol dehydrogenase-like predicted oxidoreductase
MEQRALGRTGLRVSALGFGCGNVGGLVIRGTPAERERAVARALELGITYFDTAPSYGDGLSETHLGQALRALDVTPHVGTKFRVTPGAPGDVRRAIVGSLEASLERLGLPRVDVFYLHNVVGALPRGLTGQQVVAEVAPALESLKRQGKIGVAGFTANGETAALHEIVASGTYGAAQVFYNLLNPSAGGPLPPGFPAQDFRRQGHR